MEFNEFSYCRLCAQLKHYSRLINLELNNNQRSLVAKQLKRVNAETFLLEDFLPKTVCSKCIISLDRAYRFVLCTKRAHDVLDDIFLKQNIMVESAENITDEEEYLYDPPLNRENFFEKTTRQVPNTPQDDLKAVNAAIDNAQDSNNCQNGLSSIQAEFVNIPDSVTLQYDLETENIVSKYTQDFGNIQDPLTLQVDLKTENTVSNYAQDFGNIQDPLTLQVDLNTENTVSNYAQDFDNIQDPDILEVDLETDNEQNPNISQDGPNTVQTVFDKQDPTTHQVHLKSFTVLPNNSQVGLKIITPICENLQNSNNLQDSLNTIKTVFDNAKDSKNTQGLKTVRVLVKKEWIENLDNFKAELKKFNLDALPLSQQKLTWKDYRYTCYYCRTQFPTIDELRMHSMQKHESCNPYHCTDCNVRKINLRSFIAHIKKHKKYLNLSCYKCHKKFSTEEQVNRHIVNKHEVTSYFCKGCFTTFPSAEELNDHNEIYYKHPYLNSVVQSNQKVQSTNWTCGLCNKIFKYRSTLKTHFLVHKTKQQRYICDRCGKCCLKRETLVEHLKVHDNLTEHVRTHDNKEPFACKQCGRCFTDWASCYKHMIIEHNMIWPRSKYDMAQKKHTTRTR